MDTGGRLSLGIGNVEYYLIIVDDYSRYSAIYCMKTKDQALEYFKEFKNAAENLFNKKIQKIRCDNAPEFIQGPFAAYAKEQGITFERTVPDSPQQNGVAERHN